MTDSFTVDVDNVLDAFFDEHERETFERVIVVGQLKNGAVYVASSFDAQGTYQLMDDIIEGKVNLEGEGANDNE